MRVLVCGGRDYRDKNAAFAFLDKLHKGFLIECIIHGGANGADYIAGRWAEERFVRCGQYTADWKTHGKAAGPIRNQKMLDSKPDLVVVFPGGRGTADMVRRAEAAGIKVVKPCEHVDASEEARKSDLLPIPKKISGQ